MDETITQFMVNDFTMLNLQEKAGSEKLMEIHWNILDNKRQALLPHFKDIYEEGFYLAGGTALALHIGHRNSRDFDFFKQTDITILQIWERNWNRLLKGMMFL